MKLRILLLAIAAFALSASTALAHDNGSAKHAKAHEKAELAKDKVTKAKKAKKHDAELCRPAVGVKLRGEITSIDKDGFWLIVTKANRHGKRFIAEDPAATDAAVYVKVGEQTKIRRAGEGKIEFTALAMGDSVKVKSRACKRYLRDTETTPELYAMHIKAKATATEETAGDEPGTDGDVSTDGGTDS